MRLSQHAAAAVPLAAAVFYYGGSAVDAGLAALASVFIDLDHVVDYVLYRKGFRGVGDFFRCCEEGRLTRLYLALHAWEWPALFWLFCFFAGAPSWAAAVALGVTWHLAFDEIGNRRCLVPAFYLISHRAAKGFEAALLYKNPSEQCVAAWRSRSG